jgi:hypothetical protein
MAVIATDVSRYLVAVSMSSGDDIERSVLLFHDADGMETSIKFVETQPDEWVVFPEGLNLVQVFLPLRFFEDTARLLQTEAPLRLFARADEDPPFFLVQLSSIAEEPGEGPADVDSIA